MTVYVMGCEGSRLVKIGHTSNPTKRLGEIRRMSPDPVKLLWESGTPRRCCGSGPGGIHT